jgi:hypothetical protein
MDRGLFFLDNDEINKAAEQLLVCLASAKDARGLHVSFVQHMTPEQARVGVAVALLALTGCNFTADNNVLMSMRPAGGFDVWPPNAKGGGFASASLPPVSVRDMSKEETSHITPEVAHLGTGEIKL